MTDLAKTIAPKSDQLNADDLIAGPKTITITGVRGNDDVDQPISINFEGDGGKPYKPCKSMRRVMVHCWGADGKAYAGRRATLYCDQSVQFGGIKVGGIRISHMSHIDREMILALTVTRAKRAPYKVLPLRAEVRSGPSRAQAVEPRDEPQDGGDEYTRGFDASDDDGAADSTQQTAAGRWASDVFDDLDAEVFQSTADLDEFFASQENVAKFKELQGEDPARAKKLEAALRGRGKALAGRR